MIHYLRSKSISVTIKEKGAELSSFKDLETGIEHIWQADPSFWNRHAPVLFPIVGQVEDGQYTHEGKTYELPQHGFARDCEFKFIETKNNTLVLSLESNEKTLKKYPFEFKFTISYSLFGKKLYIGYKVENKGNTEMYFQLGAHPGFTCPFTDQESFNDYKLVFDKKLTEDRVLFEDGLLNGKIQKDFIVNKDTIELDSTTFDEDAIIFKSNNIDSVLITKNGTNGLKVNVTGFPLLGIWSKPKANAPFVCIEPWYGVASVRGTSKALKDKKAIQILEKEGVFECGFSIEVV
jgi:galactose mutarotase-like enzyme